MEFILTENHRNVADDELLLDVKRVASMLKRTTLTIAEYEQYGEYNSSTLRRRFGGWKDILLLAGLEAENRNFYITDKEYLDDLNRVAEILKKKTVSNPEYKQFGKYDAARLSKRFGSWKNALLAAGLSLTGYNVSISDIELLNEIEQVWIKLGRQPTTNDIKAGVSQYGLTTYLRHFGSWSNALRTFVSYVNEESQKEDVSEESDNLLIDTSNGTEQSKHKTNRDINLRLRFLVMKRDNFKCRMCGASPATNSKVILHIDHIIPWSKGGETVFENLQTLCSHCNLGKSDLI